MRLSFHGAAQGVTGSCHLLECDGVKILVDCGMYQGPHEIAEENECPFGFDPAEIDYLLLTHAHLDHCGRIPLLYKRGFRGEIICTPATVELARLVMLDAAGLQEEEARYQMRKRRRRGNGNGHNHDGKHGRHDTFEPLYTVLDAMNALGQFKRQAEYDRPLEITDQVKATFIDAGHILGSASVVLEVTEQGRSTRLVFSGDLGYGGRVILRDPTPPPRADIVVMETTYGDRLHRQLAPSLDEFYDVLNETIGRGGNVIIPTFALERAQEILFYLREGLKEGRIKHFANVFLDSPMAISATTIFERHPECYDAETMKLHCAGRDPFAFDGLHYTRETAESVAINQIEGGAIILAGSGMCTGGRVRHHLKHNIWNRRCCIVFVGYAAVGTLARQIIDGAKIIRIYGEEIPVRAGIHTIGGFSAHADRDDLLAWHAKTGKPRKTFLVHGEEPAMRALAAEIDGHHVEIPSLHQAYQI